MQNENQKNFQKIYFQVRDDYTYRCMTQNCRLTENYYFIGGKIYPVY